MPQQAAISQEMLKRLILLCGVCITPTLAADWELNHGWITRFPINP